MVPIDAEAVLDLLGSLFYYYYLGLHCEQVQGLLDLGADEEQSGEQARPASAKLDALMVYILAKMMMVFVQGFKST